MTLAFGLWFRIYALDMRPMHTDEAVHAEKFGALLDEGFYAYDPDEYHGPTLNYLALPVAWLRGQASYIDIDEKTLRFVPAIFGTLLLLTPLLFFDGIGLRAAVFSTVLLAFSPAFVYYSRYYIQEMLLVCFTAGFLGGMWRYMRSHRRRWILFAGVCAGLMHATKETCALTFAAVMLAALLTLVLTGWPVRFSLYNRNGLLGLLAAAATSMVFFSSFGKHPDGILDSVLTYTYWLNRAGQHSIHAHPWYWYLDLMVWIEFVQPITWNEDIIAAGALFGFFFAFQRRAGLSHRRPFGVFLALFTLILTIIYSVIPYKTPWCALNFMYGMVLLAGLATDRMLRWDVMRWQKIMLCIVLAGFGVVSPLFQSVFLNTRYAAHPSNPWVYAHTGPDVFKIEQTVRRIADVHPDGKKMFIQVIAPGHDYWPLPWYLRDFEAAAYTDTVDLRLPNAPLVIGHVDVKQDVLRKLYETPPPGQRELYVPLFDEYIELRPGVEWRGVVTRSLWEKVFAQTPAAVESSHDQVDEGPIVHIQPDRNEIPKTAKFSHQAMNTVFEIWVQHEDGSYAGRAARAAFTEVDRLEQELSRFIDNSDISRINQARPGESVVVSPDTMACLKIAEEVYARTDGAFDMSVGPLVQLWRQGEPTPDQIARLLPTREGRPFELNAEELTVIVGRPNMELDLGGVAKGYAIDRMAEMLNQWTIEHALIHGGASSVRALGPPQERDGWPIRLSNPHDPAETLVRLALAGRVLSCSGLERGSHIIDPVSGRPASKRRAVWLLTDFSAAKADALTTAFMVLPTEAVAQLADEHPQDGVMLIPADPTQSPLKLGLWP